MPLLEISSEAAQQNLKKPCAFWPKRGKGNRKAVLPLPMVAPGFSITRDDSIFCMGSCFAQHIGDALSAQGFNVVTQRENPYCSGAWGWANHLLRYNIPAILNEFRWALLGTKSFPYEYFAEDDEILKRDQYGHVQERPRSFEELKALREFTFSITAGLKTSRIVAMTMGLVELWFDTATGLYTNIIPSDYCLLKHPARFKFRVLNYGEVLEILEQIHALLSSHGHPDFKILITTSPVPLHATMRGGDIFTANTYSKSVQRAAVEEFVSRHANVDYFPSYEAVTLADPEYAWKDDQRHVKEPIVGAIMEHVIHHYTGDDIRKSIYLQDAKLQNGYRQEVEEKMPGASVNTLAVLAQTQLREIQALKAELAALKKQSLSNAINP